MNGQQSVQVNRKVPINRNMNYNIHSSGGAGSQRTISQEYLMRTNKKSSAQRMSTSVLALMA